MELECSRWRFAVVPVTWLAPAIGFLKLNTDGASRGNLGPRGRGGIVRDVNGLCCSGFR